MKYTTLKIIFVCLLLTCYVTIVSAFEVEQTIWGFDGKVVPKQINPLSVLLSNPTPKAEEGRLLLRKITATGAQVGAELEKSLFISPFGQKWVQFYPYISDSAEQWVITSGKPGEKQYQLTQPKNGGGATVFLASPDSLFRRIRMRVFPENLFPSSVSPAVTTLYSVVLDHVPVLAPVQKEAFLDWVKQGGIVHLIKNAEGQYPQFKDELGLLNSPEETFRFGAGMVVKHPVTRGEITEKYLKNHGYPFPEYSSGERDYSYYQGDNFTNSFFRCLKSLVRVNHSWVLIYFLIIVYMLLIGPVNFFIGRKCRNYTKTLLFFFATVVIFALIFSYIGRRGYGEKSVINGISYARSLGDGTYDVTQWLNVFVTGSDYYKISHPGDHHYYSTCQQFERVNGIIHNGREGVFLIDIPLFSSRPFFHRGKMRANNVTLKITEWDKGKSLNKLTISTSSEFPKDPVDIFAVNGDRIYRLKYSSNQLCLEGKGMSIDAMIKKWNEEHGYQLSSFGYGYYYDDNFNLSRALSVPLIVENAMGGYIKFGDYIKYPKTDDNRLRVFVMARTPKTFFCKGDNLGSEKGYTLFHFDLINSK